MRKIISFALCIVLLVSFNACGSPGSELTEPDNAALRRDVQDYITELVDANATISILEKNDSSKDDKNLVVICTAIFGNGDSENKGVFTLTYIEKDGAWELDKCRADIEEKKEASQTASTDAKDPDTDETNIEESDTEASSTAQDTQNTTAEISLSDNWTDFTFELSGVTYQLPAPYQSFVENGWQIDTSYSYSDITEDSEIPANSRSSIYLTNGAVRISAELINMSGNLKIAANCDIGEVTVTASNNLGMKIAKGITCQSTVEEIQAAYGVPVSINTYDDYTYLKYSNDSYVNMTFYIYNQRTTNNEIMLQNFTATERDVTEVVDERPEYLNTYAAPAELSDDVTSTQFILDGVLYQLPCPLDEFIKNGWEISSDSIGTLGALNRDTGITLRKGDAKFSVGIMNLSSAAAFSKNCAVYYVDFTYSSLLKNTSPDMLVIPGTAKLGDGEDELDSAYSIFEKSIGNGYASYTYQTEDYSMKVRFWLDTDNINYNSITFENYNWDYN